MSNIIDLNHIINQRNVKEAMKSPADSIISLVKALADGTPSHSPALLSIYHDTAMYAIRELMNITRKDKTRSEEIYRCLEGLYDEAYAYANILEFEMDSDIIND